ncbi:MAG: hypothetical protein RR246_02505, partial [Clostridia bacterium]
LAVPDYETGYLIMNNELNGEKKDVITFKSRLENFWYFYKWQTIIGMIILIGIIISIVQMSSNKSPDAMMMYVGPSTLYVKDKQTISSTAEQYLSDYNNDGEKKMDLLEININLGGENAEALFEYNYSALQRFNAEVATGDAIIYVLEKNFYKSLSEQGILTKLSDVLDDDMMPAEKYDDYGVCIKNIDYFKQDGYKSMNDDLILCIRKGPDSKQINYGRTGEYWESNRVLFRAIFKYKLPTK